MPAKSEEPLVSTGYKIKETQKAALEKEALDRRYDSVSALVRDIFDAWIEEFCAK